MGLDEFFALLEDLNSNPPIHELYRAKNFKPPQKGDDPRGMLGDLAGKARNMGKLPPQIRQMIEKAKQKHQNG